MSGKASFQDVYDQPDPRAYAREMSALEYQIPQHACDVFRFLLRTLRTRRGDGFTIADLCSSYGLNAALVNHDLSLADLYARYCDPELTELTTEELVAADRAFYAEHLRPDAAPVLAIDTAAHAVAYAHRVGIVDEAAAENLETGEPSDTLRRHLARVGLFTVTGGIGYITELTFDRLLRATPRQAAPWVAAFTLRWIDMEPIRVVLEGHGLSLERLEGRTFRQRRFADERERDHAFAELRRLGLDPAGVEADGYHHASLFLARPSEEAAEAPVTELLAPLLR